MKNQAYNQGVKVQKWSKVQNTATYFVTIYTHNNAPYLGTLNNANMQLSLAGEFAYNLWKEIPQNFDNIQLHSFVIMPNHIQGIITIKNNQHNISNVMNAYMSTVEHFCHKLKHKMKWQANHYSHSINEEHIYNNIVAFINNKPKHWQCKSA